MNNYCYRLYQQFGASLLAVCLLSAALAFTVEAPLESQPQIESWFSVNEPTVQFVRVRFEEPQLQVRGSGAERCLEPLMRGSAVETTGETPRLPRRSLALSRPEGMQYRSFKIVERKSRNQRLQMPLCRNNRYIVEESFIDPEQRSTRMQALAPRSGAKYFPYPAVPVMPKTLAADIDSQRIYFITYPVVAATADTIEIISELMLEVVYSWEQRSLGFKSSAPQLRFEIATDDAIKIEIAAGGAYRLSGDSLDAIPAGTDPNTVRLWLRGEELPRQVEVSGDQISAVNFVVADFEPSFYEDRRFVWLSWDGDNGVDFASENGDPSLAGPGDSVYPETVKVASYLRQWTSLPIDDGTNAAGDPIAPPPSRGLLYWVLQYVPGPFSTRSYSFSANQPIADRPVTVTFRQRGISYYAQEPDHQVQYALNGAALGGITFDDQQYRDATFTANATLNNGVNNVTVTLPGGVVPAGSYESLAFYGFSVTYQRQMAVRDDYLQFAITTPASYTVSGFSTNDPAPLLLRLNDDRSVVAIDQTTVTPAGDGTFDLQFNATQSGIYLALSPPAFKTPVSAALDTPSRLQQITRGFKYIVVAGHGLYDGGYELAAYRRSVSGLSTLTVDVQDIYDEYNYGETSPQAIRDFLEEAHAEWSQRPRFVVLLGDSNTDPLGLLNPVNRRPALPFFYDKTFYIVIANDSRFGYLTGSGPSPDLAIGRLPLLTNDDVDRYIAKLRDYETAAASSSWMQRGTIVNDNVTQDWEAPFADSMQWMLNNTPSDYQLQHIDLGSTDAVTAQTALENAWNDGQLFVLYNGHGATQLWTDNILNPTIVGGFNATAPALPLVASMTCLTGNFNGLQESLAESLIRAENKGAIGVFASTGMTEPLPQDALARLFFENLYHQAKTVGEVLLETRVAADLQGVHVDVTHSYNYFGDPALPLAFRPAFAEEETTGTPTTSVDDSPADDTAAAAAPSSGCGVISPLRPLNADVGFLLVAGMLIVLLAVHRQSLRSRR